MNADDSTSIDDLKARLRFESLLADLSSRFVHLPADDVDREIGDALRRVCESLDIDLAALWQWSDPSTDHLVPTHAYPPELANLPEPMRREHYPWYYKQLKAGREVVVPCTDLLPAEAAVDREHLVSFGVRSSLALPLSVGGGRPLGLLGLHTVTSRRDWPEALVTRIRLVGEIFTNALARKRADEALRASEARLAAGIDLAGLGFYEVDFEAGTAYFDARLRRLLGLPPDRTTGLQPLQFWLDGLHPDDREMVMEGRLQLHDGRLEQIAREYRFLNPVAGERWVQHSGRVSERDAAGRAIRSYGVFRDITERRRADEALRQSFAEIERLKDRLQAESDYLKAEVRVALAQGEITGESPAIRKVLRDAAQVAPTGASVLICGETGTGKELVAQAIHRQSPRASQVMIKVNCAALPTGLVESELFGREKGAFTGALSRQVGRFEVADGSTIFLDEVGELPLDVQVKLLRVLQEGEFERLGSPRTVKVNVRVIAATNRDLTEEVRKGRFRQDLFYRLAVFPIRVPPLRERAEDVPPLVWTFVEDFSSRMGKKITQVPRRTMEALQRHSWPGNVRELRNVIEHAAIITTGNTLNVPLLGEATAEPALPRSLADVERDHIIRTLEQTGWQIKGPSGAAEKLGLKVSTLRSRMERLGIPYRSQKKTASA